MARERNVRGSVERLRDGANPVVQDVQQVVDFPPQFYRFPNPLEDPIGLRRRLAPAAQDGEQHQAESMLATAEARYRIGTHRFQNGTPRGEPFVIVDVQQSPDGAQQRVTRTECSRAVTEARPPAQFHEAVPRLGLCIDVFELGVRFAHEFVEPRFGAKGSEIVGETCTSIAHRIAQVAKHRLLRDSVQLERASRRQKRKVRLDGSLHLVPGAADQCPVANVVAILAPHLADEVEHRQHPLSFRPPQSPPELLEKHGGALRRSEHEHGVHLRQVDPFVEEIDGEDGSKLPSSQSRKRRSPYIPWRTAVERHCLVSEVGELAGHEVGMIDARAESKGPHPMRVRHVFLDGVADPQGPTVIAGEHVVQVARDISPALEAHRREVRRVVDAEVVKRAEQALVERIPQSRLECGATVEPLEHRLAVRTLGRGGEPEQELRSQALEQPAIARGGRMVKLVDDDHIEAVGLDVVDTVCQ